jgi:hypothetical protein
MAKFRFEELVAPEATRVTAHLGAAGAGDQLPNATYSDAEIGKAVKMTADSRYGLCAAGDAIEGFVVATEAATVDGLCLGTVQTDRRKVVTVDAGATLAVGDYVVTGAVVAKGTKLSAPQAVKKPATPTTIVEGLAQSRFAWRVVSLLGGDGSAGSEVLIERVNA